MPALARDMIAAGELGEIRGYRGIYCEDYMVDPAGAYTFRHDPAGGGALADIGSHALATAEFLCGPITGVMGDCVTMIAERPDGRGGRKAVTVDDVGRAFVRFENGASGSIEGNWIATGRKMQHVFEVYGTKGALTFYQEHFNVINFFSTADAKGRQVFRRIEASPDHAPYGLFCVAAGHQIGFNDLKAIEVAGYVKALIASASVPAVIIASPDATHAPLALACLAAGNPVLCEKPIAATAEGLAIVTAEATLGRHLVTHALL